MKAFRMIVPFFVLLSFSFGEEPKTCPKGSQLFSYDHWNSYCIQKQNDKFVPQDKKELVALINNKIQTSQIDTSKITDLSYLFKETRFNVESMPNEYLLGIKEWNVSNVTNFAGLFSRMYKFNVDISSWNVSKGEDFSSMFEGAINFNQALNLWDMRNAKDVSRMFKGATKFNQPLDKWELTNAINLEEMFANTKFSQNIDSWKIKKDAKIDDIITYSSLWENPPKWLGEMHAGFGWSESWRAGFLGEFLYDYYPYFLRGGGCEDILKLKKEGDFIYCPNSSLAYADEWENRYYEIARGAGVRYIKEDENEYIRFIFLVNKEEHSYKMIHIDINALPHQGGSSISNSKNSKQRIVIRDLRGIRE